LPVSKQVKNCPAKSNLWQKIKKQGARRLAFLYPFFLQSTKLNDMGRGDIRSKKGKIAAGSFGKSRPAKTKKATAKKAAPKK
jgi:30S ribosomal protein S31